MTLLNWVGSMDYPAKVGVSPAKSDQLENGFDFTGLLGEKLSNFIMTKDQNLTDESVMDQEELLETMHAFFTELDKEDLLTTLALLEETYAFSWDEMEDPRIVNPAESILKSDLVEAIMNLIHTLPVEQKKEFLDKFTGQAEQVSEQKRNDYQKDYHIT